MFIRQLSAKQIAFSTHPGPTALSGANGIMQLFANIRLLTALVGASLKGCRQTGGGRACLRHPLTILDIAFLSKHMVSRY
jgi:hypothetical protein